jgi:hypothetical protein
MEEFIERTKTFTAKWTKNSSGQWAGQINFISTNEDKLLVKPETETFCTIV